MRKLDCYIDEFIKYKESEGRSPEKTISRYIVYINESFEYLNIKINN